ncbi:MDR/zinc-dependent alcohol dehydrogenase-like family protein [Desulfolutivibrio sulfoxidireducens]|uniref:MDR/zinc-dependent alcohol dehydrogenase-like family protein n=1 Tax=Desulfolutivibrio sulfoxidireducens TaxID=2773299 RepID=UPI001C4002C9|nr:alcohol dehydrogenase catalytic domain-containing protein [Desulfolutivibrio sulfoxidireducens]QLA19487.1 alcohol dehydrogenase catalytic domain-containing protein [Desulfolutivibrio sulfoxidireducens]
MRAVYLSNNGMTLSLRERPEPKAGEALIRVLVAGICNTDLELAKGYMDFSGVPGHEFVGVVEAAPDAPEWLGRRVVADINWGCGRCARCLSGDPRHCGDRTTLGIHGWDGAFAEWMVAPVKNLLSVPDGLPEREAVFAEPLAAALEVSQQAHLTARTRVAVLGDGKLGILAACGLRHFCPGIVLIGRHAHKLEVAARQGVTVRLASELKGRDERFDVVVEATGRADGLARAMDMVRPEGTIVAKTTVAATAPLDLARLVVDEITVMGSRCGDLSLALHFLESRLVDVAPLIEAEYPLADFETAFARASRPGARKVLVRIDDEKR